MRILSRGDLIDSVVKNPGQTVVAIVETGMGAALVEPIVDKSNCLIIEMDDRTQEGRTGAPTLALVQNILDWANMEKPTAVACAAGISRSSAIAFLIECVSKTPEEAAKVWTLGKHHPNELILKYGVEILGTHIVPAIKDFFAKDAAQQGLPTSYITKYFV